MNIVKTMDLDHLNSETSKRICLHMNNDHKKSLLKYASQYGGIEHPIDVEMIEINSTSMQLKVDNEIINIPFDHVLVDSKDAHKTLVTMLKALPNK